MDEIKMVDIKRCSKCGVEKKLTDFNKSRNRKGGFHIYCRECSNQYQATLRRKKGIRIREDMFKDLTYKENFEKGIEKRSQNSDWIKNVKLGAQKRIKDLEWIQHQKESRLEYIKDPLFIKKQSNNAIKQFKDPIFKENYMKGQERRSQDPEWKMKITETLIGGFWYGNVRNDYTLNRLIRTLAEYKLWNRQVLDRDNNIDQITGIKCIRPEAHHIISVQQIIRDFNLKTLDDARNCILLWDINNGMCLDHDTHIWLHGYNYDNDDIESMEDGESLINDT
jgi:hypothetical protein